MASVIKEPMSPRGDHSVLVWNEEEVFKIPFNFDIKQKYGKIMKDFIIPSGWFVKMFIKDDLRHTQPMITFTYTDIVANTIYFEMNSIDSKKFRGGRGYHLNARLYDDKGVQRKILINDLPIYVREG